MDAIKKKMQAMKLEKDNAMDKADACEGQAKEANMRADKVNEEVNDLQKKLVQVEGDLQANKQNLEQANKDLEEKEKALTNVSAHEISFPCSVLSRTGSSCDCSSLFWLGSNAAIFSDRFYFGFVIGRGSLLF